MRSSRRVCAPVNPSCAAARFRLRGVRSHGRRPHQHRGRASGSRWRWRRLVAGAWEGRQAGPAGSPLRTSARGTGYATATRIPLAAPRDVQRFRPARAEFTGGLPARQCQTVAVIDQFAHIAQGRRPRQTKVVARSRFGNERADVPPVPGVPILWNGRRWSALISRPNDGMWTLNRSALVRVVGRTPGTRNRTASASGCVWLKARAAR